MNSRNASFVHAVARPTSSPSSSNSRIASSSSSRHSCVDVLCGSAFVSTSERQMRASHSSDRSPETAASRAASSNAARLAVDVADLVERDAEVVEDRPALGVGGRTDRQRTLEKVRRGGEVVSPRRSPSSRREAGSRPPADRVGTLVRWGELHPVRVGLLQVVTDDLFLLDDRFPSNPLQPFRDALVQLGASGLRDRVVRRVADQQMAETERILARQASSARGGSAPCERATSDPRAPAGGRPRARDP